MCGNAVKTNVMMTRKSESLLQILTEIRLLIRYAGTVCSESIAGADGMLPDMPAGQHTGIAADRELPLQHWDFVL